MDVGVSPFAVMVAAIGLGIGHYAVFSAYLGSRFIKRCSAVKDAFLRWQDRETENFWKALQEKAVKKEPPTEIVKFVREWVGKNSVIVELWDVKYRALERFAEWVWGGCLLSFITALIALFVPSALPTFQIMPVSAVQT